MKRIGWSAIGLSVVCYLGVVGWFVVNEPKLIFFPKRGPVEMPPAANLPYERVVLEPGDGVKLVCWLIPSTAPDSNGSWVVYLHGNGGNLASSWIVGQLRDFHDLGLNIFAIDYRGYGESTGVPSETGFYADARAAYNYVRWTRRVSPSHIVLYGFSLGAGVAIDLASSVDVAGLIVHGAMLSIPDRGQELYPFLPVKLMARNRFASKDKISGVAAPTLFLHARDDEVVPLEHGRVLFEKAGGPKTFVVLGGGHNDSHRVDSVNLYGAISSFIARQQD